jgi:hypothetical protein
VFSINLRGRHGRDSMVVGLTLKLWVQIPQRWGVLDTTLCNKVKIYFSDIKSLILD